jgi:diguanylate cyclase (GGDEF)-like protein/PAS domain S-box-containing protein
MQAGKLMSSFIKPFLLRINREAFKIRILRILPWLVLSIFLLVTWQLWKIAQSETERVLQTEFNFRVQDTSRQIGQQMLVYEKMLRGVQGLFAASASVNREEFRAYVNLLEIAKNYPGVQGLGFTLLLPQQEKDRHIASVRRQGHPEYAIRPEGERKFYSTVLYLEPFAGRNLHAFGYDNFADPVRRPAMERVRDTGLSSISPKVTLVQETDSAVQSGFLMWMPVYKNGVAHAALAERRANFYGWVGASFRMDDLIASIFGVYDNTQYDLEIFDGEEMTDQSLMHDSNKTLRQRGAVGAHFHNVSLLEIAGRKWTIAIASLPEFDKRLSDQKQRYIALAGITVSVLLALITAMLVHGRTRALRFAQALKQELTERKRAEAGMRLAEKVFDTVDAAVLVTDEASRIIKVNPAFTVITGYSAEEAIGHDTSMLSSGAHTPEFYQEMWDSLKRSGSWQGEIFNRKKNGEFYTEWLSINAVHDNEGRLTNYVALFSDISERKAAEAQMHNLAHYDPLSGLPNRTLLSDRLQQAIAAAKRDKLRMALMFIDLDKFKPINDSLGHHIGDLLLKEVASRMLDCLRESDTAARIGGDEFVVLLPVIDEASDALAVAEKIRHAIFQTFELAGRGLNISASIGVAIYPEHGSDEKTLLTNADTAMYFAKEAGRNYVMMYEQKMKRGG